MCVKSLLQFVHTDNTTNKNTTLLCRKAHGDESLVNLKALSTAAMDIKYEANVCDPEWGLQVNLFSPHCRFVQLVKLFD